MKLGSFILLLAVIATPGCGGGGGSSDAAGSPTLSASFVPEQSAPGSNTVAMAEGAKSNDVVTINVALTTTNGVYAAALEVLYDDAHTAYLGFTPGSALEQGGNSTNYTVDAVGGATSPGRIVVGVSRTGTTTTNISGTKTVVGLQFRVKQAGVYPVLIQNASLYDGQSTPQPLSGISWFAGAISGI